MQILEKKRKFICTWCKNHYPINENINSECKICKNKMEVRFEYEFQEKFLKNAILKRAGSWFEWYVYMLNNHIYTFSDHNLEIEFEKNGIKKKCEIDVISIINEKIQSKKFK